MGQVNPTRKQRSSRAQKALRLQRVASCKWRGLTDSETLAELQQLYGDEDRLDWLPRSYDRRMVWKDWAEILGSLRQQQQVLAEFHLTVAQHDLDVAMAKVRTELQAASGATEVAALANALRQLVHELTDLYALRTPLNIDDEVKRRLQALLEEEGLLDDITMDEVWEEFRAVLPEVKV